MIKKCNDKPAREIMWTNEKTWLVWVTERKIIHAYYE